MDRLAKFFMRRRTLFWALMVGILVMGVLSYLRMPKLEDPAIAVKQASVILIYPGADAHQVEIEAAQPVEDAMRTLPDIRKIKTECRPGQAIINVEFEMELPVEELEQRFDLIRRKASDVAMTLPQGCMEPIVVDDMVDVYGLLFTMTGDGYTFPEMERYAKMLRRELLTVSGVRRVNIGGVPSEVLTVEFSASQLARNGLMPTQVMMALQSAAKTVDAGAVNNGSDRLAITVSEAVVTEKDLANLLIDTPEGKKVRLGDLAKITRSTASPKRNQIFADGEKALTLAVTLENSAIVPDVGKEVDAKIAEVSRTLPAGMVIEKVFYQPDKVSDAVEGFMLNLLESVLIVIVVLMFSMGWRSGVIIGFGLVLTVALSFPILANLGTTLQRISLGAFIVAMGMLVDNAVVIMDGILVDRQRGLRPETYLYRIGRDTALPLLGATVVAACTFLPIYLTPGSVGEFAGDLFLVICVSLLVSWVLALVQVPVCAAAWIGSKDPAKGAAEIEASAPKPNAFNRVVGKLLRWLIGHKAISVTCAIAILLCAVAGMTRVRQVFFPDFDYKQFIVECYFEPESHPEAVADRVLALADSAKAFPGVDRVVVSTGGAPARYTLVRPMPTGGDNYAEMIVDCADFKTMQRVQNELREHLRDIAPDAYIRTRKYNFSISSSHTVEIEFAGPDPAVLRRLSAEAEALMRECPLVDPYSVQNNWMPRGKRITFRYSQADAQRAGVNRSDVANALQAAGDGMAVGVVADGDRQVPVYVTTRHDDGSRLTDPGSIPVWSTANLSIDPSKLAGLATGATSPDYLRKNMFRSTTLAAVTDSASLGWSETYLTRLNGRRVIEAECDPDPLNPDATPAKVEAWLRDRVGSIDLPSGYELRFVGEGELSGEAKSKLIGFMPMILLIVFTVLLCLFNSWKKLFVVLVSFPFVLCGIVPLLLLTDTPFTFLAILGFMGLIGMMVKNAIVLVDEITRLSTQEGQHLFHAVVNATLSRVRPVMLASFTTIVGMIPLIPDPMYGSLAVVVIGGLFVGTIVTLLLLPLFYSILFKVKKPDNE
ncbi:MAG: efflux RND transporter permease subunit [[Clostridium] fimetarium]|nr:efflux RND transporter permease subunit [Alistipes timonensis]MCM1405335.1 efflux RND transporter permease subunit [[Clostridium] fimetarium]